MNKFIIGTKQSMTQVYDDNGQVAPVTVVSVEPCVITQVKTVDSDGYVAVQVGYGVRKEDNIAKPQRGHNKDLGHFRGHREFRIDDVAELKVGDKIEVSQFAVGETVNVSGTSKGKGYQGVVRRHNFHGSDNQHGNKDQTRMPGSIGATGPQRVFKGTRMPGQMGNASVTVSNLQVVKVDAESNQLYLRGAVPGGRNAVITIYA